VLDAVAAAAETEFQMKNKIEGANAAFNDAVINGDVAVDANGFDGLSKALTGSTTELGATTAPTGPRSRRATTPRSPPSTWSTSCSRPAQRPADRAPGQRQAALQAPRRRPARGMYTSDPVVIADGPDGTIRVEQFGNAVIVDMGTKAGSSPTSSRSPRQRHRWRGPAGNYTDLYAVRLGLDGFHGVSMAGQPLIKTWLPDFTTAGAVKTGEVELGPVSVVLKATKAAAVRRNIRLS
jgi:hypothetical protein